VPKLHDLDLAPRVADELQQQFAPDLYANDWTHQNSINSRGKDREENDVHNPVLIVALAAFTLSDIGHGRHRQSRLISPSCARSAHRRAES